MMLVELAKEAGLPDGVVNCIHGQHEGKRQFLIYINLFLFFLFKLLHLFAIILIFELYHLLVLIQL
jgi:TRAP-type C4-dicarboxylate transport system permease large subunit